MVEKKYAEFLSAIIFWGRITLWLALAVSFTPVIYLYLAHGAVPDSDSIVKAFMMIASVMLVSWTIEPIAYFPILGTSGTYMSWLAGNISNMRVPVSAVAQNVAGVQEGSPEGDIISTLGIGVSVIVNLVILVVAVAFGVQIIAVLPNSVQTAFKYILPAVFGAVLANFALRNFKLGIFALLAAFILTSLNLPVWIILPVCVFGTMGVGVYFIKK